MERVQIRRIDMKLVIGLAVIFVCIITYAFLDAAKKADKSSEELWDHHLMEENRRNKIE